MLKYGSQTGFRLRTMWRSFHGAAVFRSLHQADFRAVWAGQTLSRLGDSLFQIALAWWVLQTTGSATIMANLLIVTLIPTLLLLLFGGVAVDRFSPLRIMFASDLLRGLVVGLIALLALLSQLQLWHLYVLNLVFGLVDAFFHPAYIATVPRLVSEEDLPSANTISSMGMHFGRVAGPAIAAVIIALGGFGLALAINALTFVFAGGLIMPLLKKSMTVPKPEAAPPEADLHVAAAPSGIWLDLKIGFATVLQTPIIWVTIAMLAISNITLSGPYSIAMPFLVRDYLQADVGTLSLLYSMFAVGYVFGGLWLGRQTTIRRRGAGLYIGLATAGAMLAVFGVSTSIIVLCIAAIINGIALEVAGLIWTYVLQQCVPREQLGRVASLDALGSYALIPLGYAVTGYLTDWLGPATVFLVGGVTTAMLGVIVLLTQKRIREFD